MDKLTMLNLVIGFLSATFIIPIIQQPRWSAQVRSWITFAYSVVVGFLTSWVTGELSLKDIATSVLVVLITAIATYKGFAKPTDIAPKIEGATSPGQTPSQPGL